MENPLLVFVSSIIGESFEERKAVKEAIEAIPLTRPWVFEYTPASSDAVEESYLSKVQECDIFILLLAQNISDPVHKEWQSALAHDKPRLVFLKDIKRDPEAQAFVKQIDVKWARFGSADELQRGVSEAVIDELIRGYRRYRLRAGEACKLKGLRWRAYIKAIVENERFARWGDNWYIEEKARPLPMRVAPREMGLYALEEWPKRDLIEAVEEILASENVTKRCVLILGDAGAGKTTALERLMLLHAQRAMADNSDSLPILVALDRYAGQDSLTPLLVASLNELGRFKLTERQVEVLLRDGTWLVMFDGLNELGKWGEKGTRLIRSFMDAYSHNLYIITCRTQVYRNEFRGIEALEIQELEDEDIRRYFQVHLGEKKGRSLYWLLDERLRGLARNPLTWTSQNQKGFDLR